MSIKSRKRTATARATGAAERSGVNGLRRRWPRIHRTDCEPWPQVALIERWAQHHPEFRAWLASQQGAPALVRGLLEAWQTFHDGEFSRAIALAQHLGPPGAVIANKAAAVDTLYSERAPAQILKSLEQAIERGERAVATLEDYANAHYTLALVLGRYSQRISILTALAEGLGGRIRAHLERALALEPRHAEAHLALGLYHAEIVAKLGPLTASLAYGASRAAGLEHFEHAVKLAPASPIVLMEFAHGLLLLDGSHRERALELYRQAAACEPADAMEGLDVARARRGLQ